MSGGVLSCHRQVDMTLKDANGLLHTDMARYADMGM